MIFSVHEATLDCHLVVKLPELVWCNQYFQIVWEAETNKSQKGLEIRDWNGSKRWYSLKNQKCFQGFWGSESGVFSGKLFIHCLSGNKREKFSLFLISKHKDYRIRYRHLHQQHLKETAGMDLHRIWYRILPLMKASNKCWYPLKAWFCIWNNWMKTWRWSSVDHFCIVSFVITAARRIYFGIWHAV